MKLLQFKAFESRVFVADVVFKTSQFTIACFVQKDINNIFEFMHLKVNIYLCQFYRFFIV